MSSKTEPLVTGFEKNNNQTATYFEAIDFYKKLAERHDEIRISETGNTDSGQPLHEVIISSDALFTPEKAKDNKKVVLFMNNAIHPGEPCGVDASMMLVRDLVNEDGMRPLLDEVVIVVVPFYNIGGGLNRNSTTRTNQHGPESYGFRGNAKNLDLNRDFIKCDSENAKTFNQLFTKWNPHIFIDNHTSNGADYQYTMTLIPTQKDKLEATMSQHMTEKMLPDLYERMKNVNWEMAPYVFARNTPDEGIAGFMDLPRYSSGYAALHNSISFMPEAHMLKPYEGRVKSTYHFMKSMLEHIKDQNEAIISAKEEAMLNTTNQKNFALNWTMDMERVDTLTFKGYEAKYKPSQISGHSRLYYDRDAPYTKEIPFYNSYKASISIKAPKAYIIPQAYSKVVERLRWNGVMVEQLEEDQKKTVESYYIKDFKTVDNAYEGHYLHYNVALDTVYGEWQFYKGDYIVRVNQPTNRYIVETLEPQAPDSYFAWNFFDGILMQKEYFSSYVFEDLAVEILEKDPVLRQSLEEKKRSDEEFAGNARAQLNFIYKRSPHFEKTYNRYPVARVVD